MLGQRGEPEIVQDKKSDGADLAQPALVGGIAATGVNPVEQHAGALIGDLISLATGDVPERLSCVALADAAWTNQKDILRPLDEAAGSEFAQGRRVDARIEREIEGLQDLVRRQTALGESAPELLEVAPFGLVGEQGVEKLSVAPRAASWSLKPPSGSSTSSTS